MSAVIVTVIGYQALRPAVAGEPIQVGILHSQSGTMAVSEMPLIEATVLAIEETERGRWCPGSAPETRHRRRQVRRGTIQVGRGAAHSDRPCVRHFGCMNSPCRKAVKTIVEQEKGLLFYPVSYEGLEQSQRIVYVGAAPNQKFLPGVDYLVKKLGKKRLYYLGSDLVSPRSAMEVVGTI